MLVVGIFFFFLKSRRSYEEKTEHQCLLRRRRDKLGISGELSHSQTLSASMSVQPLEHADHLILFRTAPAKGKWLALISRLLNNETPRSALGEENTFEQLQDLCKDAKDVLSNEAVVLSLDIKQEDERLVLVGDIHGQFRDLQTHILSVQQRAFQAGESDYKFLFLGDYVDRGPHGVEVMMLLLALKVEYPGLIYTIRGNHEESQTCRVYGFFQECRAKLDMECWTQFVDVFRHLPLAAAVSCPSGSFFCTHGGLNPHTSAIDGLQFLHRAAYGDTDSGYDLPGEDLEAIDGLLWSDPSDDPGYKRNYRGCGFTFGADASAAFCDFNKVQFICRAHQMVMEGYKWDHDEKVLTLFSAPNYCGMNDNRGAIAVLDCKRQLGCAKVMLEFTTYDVAPASPSMIYGAASPSSVVVDDYFAAASPTGEPPQIPSAPPADLQA